MRKALFRQIIVEPFPEIVDNTIAVLHHRRGDLNASGAEQDKLQCVHPGFHAAHRAQMHSLQRRILCQFRDKTKRNGLDGVAAVSTHSRFPVYRRRGDIGMRVDSDHALDRVDGCNAIRTCAFGCLSRGAHNSHIWGELCQDRELRSAPCSSGKALDQLRHLSDIGSETAVRHVGAGKVQLDRIRSVFFTQARKALPLRIGLPHERRQNEFARIVLFQSAENLHVLRHAVVGELLDVLKADDASAVSSDGRKPRRSLVDRKGTDRFERSACPARFKRSGAHVIGAGHH